MHNEQNLKIKNTKCALILSSLALIICASLFVGSTYAWFSDSVSSAGNKVVAGTLDVQLLADEGAGYRDISESGVPIFGAGSAEDLWEPGKTRVAYLAVKNSGTLSLKYKVMLNVEDIEKDLYEVMEYTVADQAQYGAVTEWTAGSGQVPLPGVQEIASNILLEAGETHYFALSVHMKETADAQYMGGQASFDILVAATQASAESDSFGNQYDAGATLDYIPVSDAEELRETP